MSTLLAEPPQARAPPQRRRGRRPAPRPPRSAAPLGGLREASLARRWPTLLVAAVLCLVTFVAGGGLNLGPMTTVEIGLTVGCGLAIAAAIVLTPPAGRPTGCGRRALLLAFAALSALSVVWSVQPDASWQAASRLLAYSGVFGLAVLLARAAPRRWSAVLGGVLLASVVVCGYALLTKVFPNRLGSEQVAYYARLREPYGYWNATGLAAALGAIACLWLGARRAGHALLSALAYPAMGHHAGDADAGLLARRAGRAGPRARAVALPRATAPARRDGADRRRRWAPPSSSRGTSPQTPSRPTARRSRRASTPATSSVCCSRRCCSC